MLFYPESIETVVGRSGCKERVKTGKPPILPSMAVAGFDLGEVFRAQNMTNSTDYNNVRSIRSPHHVKSGRLT